MKIPASPLQLEWIEAKFKSMQAETKYASLQEQQRQQQPSEVFDLAVLRRANEDVRIFQRQCAQLETSMAAGLKKSLLEMWDPFVVARQCALLGTQVLCADVPTTDSGSSTETYRSFRMTFRRWAASSPETASTLGDFHDFLTRACIAMVLGRPTSQTISLLLTVAHHALHSFRDFNTVASIACALQSAPVQGLSSCTQGSSPLLQINSRDQSAIQALGTLLSPTNDYHAYWDEYEHQLLLARSTLPSKQFSKTSSSNTNPWIVETPRSLSGPPCYAVPYVTPMLERLRWIRDEYHSGNTTVEFEKGLSTAGLQHFEDLLLRADYSFDLSSLSTEQDGSALSTKQSGPRAPSKEACLDIRNDITIDKEFCHFLLTRVYFSRRQLIDWSRSLAPSTGNSQGQAEGWDVDSEPEEVESTATTEDPPARIAATESAALSNFPSPIAPGNPSPTSPENQDFSDLYDDILGAAQYDFRTRMMCLICVDRPCYCKMTTQRRSSCGYCIGIDGEIFMSLRSLPVCESTNSKPNHTVYLSSATFSEIESRATIKHGRSREVYIVAKFNLRT